MTVHLQAVTRQLAQAVGAPRASETHLGEVVSVQPGPPPTLTLKLDGSSTQVAGVAFTADCDPQAGDTVLVELLGSDSRQRQSWVCTGVLASVSTAWQTLAFTGGWVAGINPGYRRVGTEVRMRGTVTSGTMGSAICQLPTGYRPPQTAIFAVDSYAAYGMVQVATDGTVVAHAGTNTRISLDNVRFDTVA